MCDACLKLPCLLLSASDQMREQCHRFGILAVWNLDGHQTHACISEVKGLNKDVFHACQMGFPDYLLLSVKGFSSCFSATAMRPECL